MGKLKSGQNYHIEPDMIDGDGGYDGSIFGEHSGLSASEIEFITRVHGALHTADAKQMADFAKEAQGFGSGMIRKTFGRAMQIWRSENSNGSQEKMGWWESIKSLFD